MVDSVAGKYDTDKVSSWHGLEKQEAAISEDPYLESNLPSGLARTVSLHKWSKYHY